MQNCTIGFLGDMATGDSENAKDGYMEDGVEARLEVSRKLGLYLFC